MELNFIEFNCFCIGTFQFAEDAATCIPWSATGYYICTVKELAVTHAAAWPLECLCISRSNEINLLILASFAQICSAIFEFHLNSSQLCHDNNPQPFIKRRGLLVYFLDPVLSIDMKL